MAPSQPEDVWDSIHKALWPNVPLGRNGLQDYEWLCAAVLREMSRLDEKHSLSEGDALSIFLSLQPSAATTRQALMEAISAGRDQFRQDPAATEDVTGVIVWCWTMVAVDLQGDHTHASSCWRDEETLEATIKGYFRQPATSSKEHGPRVVHLDLSAAALEHDHNVRIQWTPVITEHLRLTTRGETIWLSVFEHKIWVKNQLETGRGQCAVPAEVLEELMLTFNLLFHIYDKGTERLLERCGRKASILNLGYCGRDLTRDLSRYKFWRGRVAALDDLFNGPQLGFRGVWRLSRSKDNLMNVVVFWTSGVAVVVLAVVSSICGIWSVVIAQNAYKLAVAQACADPDVRDNLPEYCQ